MDSFSFFIFFGISIVIYLTIKVFLNNTWANVYIILATVIFIILGGLNTGIIKIGPSMEFTDSTPQEQLYHTNITKYNELYRPNITPSNHTAPNLSSYNPYSKVNLSIDSSIDVGDLLE